MLIVRVDHGTQTEISLMVDSNAQTNRTETTDANTQALSVPTTPPITPSMVCHPQAESRVASKAMTLSSELLKDNNELESSNFLLAYRHGRCFTICQGVLPLYLLSDSLLLTLMRLRLNLRMEDLLYRFSIPVSTVVDVFHNA